MTYLDLQHDAMDMLNATSGEARARIKRSINQWYSRILSRIGFSRVRDASATITTVAGTAEYTVTGITGIVSIVDTTNATKLVERPLATLRALDPENTSSGNPIVYCIRKVSNTTFTVRLWPIPDSVLTLAVDAAGRITPLSADADVPVLPEDYHWLLSLGARINEYEKMDDSRFGPALQEMEREINHLRFSLVKTGAGLMQGDLANIRPASRFGPWFTE